MTRQTQPAELAWAAGFFDGEGSCSVQRAQNGNYYPQACISQVDRAVLDRFVRAVGVGRVYGPYSPTGMGIKPIWQYHLHGFPNVSLLLQRLRPWLSGVKTLQAEAALAKYAENGDRRWTMTHEARRELRERLKGGERGSVIARAMGLSPKVVSYHKRKHETKMLDAGQTGDPEEGVHVQCVDEPNGGE